MNCIILLLSMACNQSGHGDQESSALEKCLQSIEKIQQLSCRVEYRAYDRKGSPTRTDLAQYVRNGAKFRIKETLLLHGIDPPNNTTETDIYSDDDITRKVLSKHRGIHSAGIGALQSITNTQCDAYHIALFHVFNVSALSHVPLKEFAKKLGNTAYRAALDDDSRQVIVLAGDYLHSNLTYRYTFHFDASANFLIKSIQIDFTLKDGKQYQHRFQVLRFAEVEPSIFFPVETKRECYVDNQLLWFADMKLTEVMINKELPSQALDFRFPHGIEILDTIRSSKYRVDEHGNRISEEKPVQLGQQLPSIDRPPGKK